MATSNPNIIGSDGAVPQYDPDGRWTIWNLDEIYIGGAATRKFVPKIFNLASTQSVAGIVEAST